MEKESRQVRRARERKEKKKSPPSTHEQYYVQFTRKSRSGVLHKYYKKIVDFIGRRK